MKGFREKRPLSLKGGFGVALLLLAFCYAAGAAAACLAYHFAGFLHGGEQQLQESRYFTYLWRYLKYPLVSFVCGYSVLGLLVQPCILAAGGYLTSSAVILLVKYSPSREVISVLIEHSLTGMVSLAALLFLAAHGLCSAGNAFARMTNRRTVYGTPSFPTLHLARFFLCAISIAAAAALNILLAPHLTALLIK